MTAALKTYLQAIAANLKLGNATEHTHRPALKTLLETLGAELGVADLRATNEPQRIVCGAPDYIVTRGVLPLGYVEAKDVGANLAKVAASEQLQRYRASLDNLVLTDYVSFQWYLDGELKLTAALPQPSAQGKFKWNDDAASAVHRLLAQFLQADAPVKATPHDLATRMAGLAQLMRDLIAKTYAAEDAGGELHAQFEGFKRVLIETLTPPQFADMYAQTLCYGLFAARCTQNAAQGAGFTRQAAAALLPKTNPFLRKLFQQIAGPDLDGRIAWAVDQLAQLLARADMAAILQDFGKRTRREDPVVHFYETFLAAYDPGLREKRGVYYTPEPVVGYIVRSVDALLQREFGLQDGLADSSKVRWQPPRPDAAAGNANAKAKTTPPAEPVHRVQILDPATGTATFLYEVIRRIHARFAGNQGAWPGYVAQHLLPRLFGFELLMAPYAVAHMKLGLELERTGYDFPDDQRLGLFLTNSLEEAHASVGMPLFAQWLAQESIDAARVKRDAPVMVVLGNPPYSGHSLNKGAWIEDLMAEYKRSPELHKPAQAKWLSDDYVKFIRFAQWRIERTGHGILAFITNHGYLDNPTFMDMRESLLKSFDSIWLYDLHGNSKKKETAPDGGKDENVFDIQQGVAIALFVRHAERKDHAALARVFHADLYGTRDAKYAVLAAESVTSTEWQEVQPAEPAYLFIPQNAGLRTEYENGWSLRDIFAPNGDPAPGIVTTHDQFAISWTREEAVEKVEKLLATQTEAEARGLFRLCSQNQWQYDHAKRELADGAWREKIVPILYRPFDVRWTVYDSNVAVHRRTRASDNLLHPNFALCTTRAIEISRGWEHVWVSTRPIQHHTVSIKEVNYQFPLWLYPRAQEDLLDTPPQEKQPNLAPAFLTALTQAAGAAPAPEDVLAYLYAVLYTPGYRARYADFLKRDFPRVPLTTDRALFAALVAHGRELIALHTMAQTLPLITGYPIVGSNVVDKVRFTPAGPKDGSAALDGASHAAADAGRVWINAAQYFQGVPQAVWDTHIGGYRVAEKWLKDRKGRTLSYDDLTHYQQVIAALARTLHIQQALDAAIAQAGGWPLR